MSARSWQDVGIRWTKQTGRPSPEVSCVRKPSGRRQRNRNYVEMDWAVLWHKKVRPMLRTDAQEAQMRCTDKMRFPVTPEEHSTAQDARLICPSFLLTASKAVSILSLKEWSCYRQGQEFCIHSFFSLAKHLRAGLLDHTTETHLGLYKNWADPLQRCCVHCTPALPTFSVVSF